MGAGRTRRVAEASFLLAANGASDAPPAAALRDWLVARGATVTTVFHPLEREERPRHEVVRYAGGREVARRAVTLPSRPPYTYPLDLLVPAWPEPVDVWFGFTNLLCARGLVARRLRRADQVVLWSVDFVPDRFGAGLLTRVYDAVDALCCRRADARVELSRAALEGRNERHGLRDGEGARPQIVPIGTWLARVPQVPDDGLATRRLVFIGHLVERMGVGLFLDALGLLARRGVAFDADVAGRGPLEEPLRARAAELGIAERVVFHGFVADHRELEALLAGCAVALAPYQPVAGSFTRFADPSKLKSYLGAGLPIVLTDVPPNARELADRAGAEIVPYDATALADALERLLDAPEEWRRRRTAALEYARGFDWDVVLERALGGLGYGEEGRTKRKSPQA